MLVRSNGDTLRGEIENGFWNEPPTLVRFRPAPGSASQVFEPSQVRAFSLLGGRYFRYETLPIDQAAETQLKRLPLGNAVNIKTESLLAEVLVEGPCTLFRVATLGTTHFLLSRPGKAVLDLSERKYLSTGANGFTSVADGNNYRSQLALYFLDCPAAGKVAETSGFTPQALVAVVQAYNQQCDSSHQPGRNWLNQAAPGRAVSLQGGVLLGGRYNIIESPTGGPGSDCSDCQVHPFGGLYADLFLPGRSTAVYGELSLSSFRNRGALISGIFPNSYYDYKGLLGTARIGIRRFVSLPNEQKLLFGIGFERNIVWRPTVITTSGPPVVRNEADLTFPAPTLLPNLGVGWRSRRLTISLDGQLYQSNDALDRSVIGTGVGIRLGTSYRLGRNPDDVKPRPAASR
ncbi:hypothetical protein GCM10027511_09260 [Hymenobacter humi]